MAGVVGGGAVRDGPAVPVSEQQQMLLCRGIESGYKIPEPKRVVRGGDMIPALHQHSVGSSPEQTVQPVPHLLVGWCPGNSRAERHLRLDIREGGGAGEFLWGPRLLPAAEEQERGTGGDTVS